MVKRVVLCFLAFIGCLYCLVTITYADPLKSANYQVDESFIGGGGLIESNSAHYKLGGGSAIGGSTAGGGASSANYQANLGYPTTGEPSLVFAVTDSSADFGNFSATSAATATSSFEVSNYTSYGYVVQIMGDPPTNGTHTITAMASTGPSVTGEDQFGINLVANTSPASFGANPTQVPDNTFSFGQVAANYNTSNNFRYVDGETIASAPKSSGVTAYTISYIVNVKNLTPGGVYTSHQSVVCMATY
jgi:hypothetical protein